MNTGAARAQTFDEYGVTNKDKVQDAVEYAEWLDAAHIKVRFKNGKEIIFEPSGKKDNGRSDLMDERLSYEKGYGVLYGKSSPSHGCYAAVRIDINENKSNLDKLKTTLDTVNIDIDFRPNTDSDCVDGNEFDIKPRNPKLSIAYFKWSAPNQITTVDGDKPGSFTKGTSTATIDGKTYDVYMRDAESGASKCKDKLVLDKASNKVMWYELDDKYTGNTPDDVSSTCDYNEDSLPTGNYFWDIANSPQSVAQIPPATPGGTAAGGANDAPSCEGSVDNGFGWIICPALSAIDGFIDGAEAVIASKLAVNTDYFEGATVNGVETEGLRNIWLSFARFSSGILVLIALFMIISTALGFEFVSAYTVKKVLPRIVIGAVGIWLSWSLVVTYISFMNDLGRGVASLMYSALPEAKEVGLERIVAIAAEKSDPGTDLAAGALFSGLTVLGISAAGLPGIMLAALSALVAIVVGVLVLAVRELLILMAVILAPFAIVSWILPNTSRAWKFWSSNLNKLLLMFPMIMALFAGAKIMALISAELISSNPGFLEMLFPVIIYVLPLFFLPKLFKTSGGILTGITGAVNKATNSATAGKRASLTGMQEARKKRRDEDRARAQRNRQANGVTVFGRQIPGSRTMALKNQRLRSGQAVLPITPAAKRAARLADSRATQAQALSTQKELDEVLGGDLDAKSLIATGRSYRDIMANGTEAEKVTARRMAASGSSRFLGDRHAQAGAAMSLASMGRVTEEHVRKLAENFADDQQAAAALVSQTTRTAKGAGQTSIGAMKYDYETGKVGYEEVVTDAAGVPQRDSTGKVLTRTVTDPVARDPATGAVLKDASGKEVANPEYVKAKQTQTLKAVAEMSAEDKDNLGVKLSDDGVTYEFKDKGLQEAFMSSGAQGAALAQQMYDDPSLKLTDQQKQALYNIMNIYTSPSGPGTP